MTRLEKTLGIAAAWLLLTLSAHPTAAQSLEVPGGQQPHVPTAAVAAPQPASSAIGINEIPGRLLQTAGLVRRAASDAHPLSTIHEIEQRLPGFQEGTRALLAANREALKEPLSVGTLVELREGWGIVRAQLSGWQAALGNRSGALQRDLDALNTEATSWTAAQDAAAAQELPADLRSQIGRAIDAIRGAKEALLTRRNVVLKLQADISQLSIEADEMAEVDRRGARAGTRAAVLAGFAADLAGGVGREDRRPHRREVVVVGLDRRRLSVLRPQHRRIRRVRAVPVRRGARRPGRSPGGAAPRSGRMTTSRFAASASRSAGRSRPRSS